MEEDSGYFFFQSPWKNIFLWHFMEIEREGMIVTPVIDMDILRKIQSILIARSSKDLKLRILLRFSENDVLLRGIDPETLRILDLLKKEPNSRIEIRFLPNLSLTAMVLDNKKALMATGDLSSDSLLNDMIYGQLMTGKDIVGAFKEDLMELWKEASEAPKNSILEYMNELKGRIALRKELVFEDTENDIVFSDDDFIRLGKPIAPKGKDRQEPHLDEVKKIIKELLIRARDSVEEGNSQTALFYLEEGLTLDRDNMDLLLEKGKILYEMEDDIDNALICFDKVLDQDEDSRDAWAYSGMCHHKRGELEDALYAYDQATDIDSHHYPVWIKKGIVLGSMKNRAEDALKCLEFALSQDPYNEEAWYHKASILDQRLKRMDEAILAYRSLLRINPKHVVGSFRMGLLSYKKLDDMAKAKKYFNRVVETAPDHKQAWLFKAEIADEFENDFGSAYDCLEKAREHYPDDVTILTKEISLLLKHKKKFSKANELSDELLKLEPKSSVAQYVSGLGILKSENEPEEALRLMNSAIRSDPKFKPAILSKANILAEYLNRAEDAVNLLRAALKRNSEDVELWMDLGVTYFDFMYDPKEALKCFNKVTILDNQNSEGWYNKGMTLSRGFDKHQEGLKCLDEATKLDDDHYMAWFEKGRILYRNYKMLDDSLACLEKSISIEADEPAVLSLMAEVYLNKKDPKKAEEYYRKALEYEDVSLDTYFGLSELKIGQGQYDEAQAVLNSGLQVDNKNERIWMMKADTFRISNEPGKAVECYKRIIRINPDNQDALNKKTSVEAQLERMS